MVTSYSVVTSEFGAFTPDAKDESKSKAKKKQSQDNSDDEDDDEPVFPWELFIERSQSAPLYIVWDVVRIGQVYNYGTENFSLLFDQRRRWKELYV